MKPSYIYFIVGIIIVIAALFGVNMYLTRTNTATTTPPVETPSQDEGRPDITITAKHQFEGGHHIIAGEVDLPTPCHILDWNVIRRAQDNEAETLPPKVTIAFTATTQADTCAQVITPARFKIEFDADENVAIDATMNGKPAVLNLIPADPGEDLNNFEIYIKG